MKTQRIVRYHSHTKYVISAVGNFTYRGRHLVVRGQLVGGNGTTQWTAGVVADGMSSVTMNHNVVGRCKVIDG